MLKFLTAAAFALLVPCILVTQVSAEPHSTPVQITAVRIYSMGNSNSDFAAIDTSAAGVCPAYTNFSFQIGTAAGQGMLANAMTALSTGQRVTIEVSNATGCTLENNAGPAVQSLTLLAPGFPGPW